MMKQSKGITLVALIVTIILLLILSAISISSLTGSGLFTKAQEAFDKSEKAQEKEQKILEDYEKEIVLGGKSDETSYDISLFDEWSTWLYLAGIENPKTYNKTDILSNTELMQKVMNNTQAVNYMVNSIYFIMPAVCKSEIAINYIRQNNNTINKVLDSGYWVNEINLNGYMNKFEEFTIKIPTQTQITENMIYSGQLLSSTTPCNAFNGILASGWSDLTMWQDTTSNEEGYIGYDFKEKNKIYKFEINYATYRIENQYSFILQGLNEDGSWENIGDEYITNFKVAESFITDTYNVFCDKEYYGYRIKNNYPVSGNGTQYWSVYGKNGFGIGELQFYCIKSTN